MIRILVIEDDEHIQHFLGDAIQKLASDIQLIYTSSAAEALDIALKQQVDVFVVDIQLVDYKGTDLVKQLRHIPAYKYTPIVFETAIITEELRAYRELKCYHYLMKPYTKEEIQQVMIEVLNYLKQATKEDPKIRIEQKGFILEYRLQSIWYVESFGKHMMIHLINDQGKLYQEKIAGYSLKAIMELLQTEAFVQCHKSYIINTTHIEAIHKVDNLVKLRSCETLIPIGLKYRERLL